MFGGEPSQLYRDVPSARRAFCSARRGGTHRGSTVAAAPGITTKATSLFIAISTYISHTCIEDREKGRRRQRKLARAGEGEGKREEMAVSISLSPSLSLFARFLPLRFPFATYILPPPFFPRYTLASGETHTCSYVTVTVLSRCDHA